MIKYFCYLCVICLFSCKTNGTREFDGTQIFVDTEQAFDSLDISFVIESVDILPLNEKKGNFIGQAHKLIRTSDHCIIFDRRIAKKVVVFDNKGNFLKNVITLGKGPGEAIQLNDIWLDSKGNLEIYDYAQKKIFTCDENFDIIKETKGANYIFSALTRFPKNDNFVGFKNYSAYNPPYKGEYYQVAFLNSNLRKIIRVDNIYDEQLNGIVVLEGVSPFQNVNDTLRFSTCFKPFIYDVVPDKGLIEKYEFVYSPNAFPKEYEKKILMNHRKQLLSTSDYYETKNFTKGFSGYGGNWLEVNKYAIFSSFNTDYERIYSIFDKKNGTIVANAKLFNSLVFKFKRIPDFKATVESENSFTTMISGPMLHYYLEDNHPLMQNTEEIIDKNYILTIKFKS